MVLWRRLDLYVVAGALAASIVTIWYASLPSIFDSPRLIGIATALWLATAIVWVADMARAQRDDSPLARRLLLAPALVVLVVVVSLSPWPERVRFDLSRGALDAAASRVALGQHVAGRIGGYAVTQDGIDGGVVTLHIGELERRHDARHDPAHGYVRASRRPVVPVPRPGGDLRLMTTVAVRSASPGRTSE